MLSTLLHHADDDPQTGQARTPQGGRAFVSMSLRPYLLAALLDRDPARPRSSSPATTARRATSPASLRAWLAPRPVRYYPSRGVTYESHLSPPPHLVGQRIAALDALLDSDGRARRPGRRRQRRRALGEGPRPVAAPARLHAASRAS